MEGEGTVPARRRALPDEERYVQGGWVPHVGNESSAGFYCPGQAPAQHRCTAVEAGRHGREEQHSPSNRNKGDVIRIGNEGRGRRPSPSSMDTSEFSGARRGSPQRGSRCWGAGGRGRLGLIPLLLLACVGPAFGTRLPESPFAFERRVRATLGRDVGQCACTAPEPRPAPQHLFSKLTCLSERSPYSASCLLLGPEAQT